MRSVLQDEKRCLICGTTLNLENHHVFFGSDRKASDRAGLTVWVCADHHRGPCGVHHDPNLDRQIKRWAQKKFEAQNGHDAFMALIGRNYL